MKNPCFRGACPSGGLAALLLSWALSSAWGGSVLTRTNAPTQTTRLVFIHHSTGEAWLADDHGGLGSALRDNNYFVSDTNYGWGPDSVGDTTDIGHWWRWFRGPDSGRYLDAVFEESERHCDYSRLSGPVTGMNRVILFKSCFPNSALQGGVNHPVPSIESNPLKEQDAYSDAHTVANAKGIYQDLLAAFGAMTDRLFVAITAPPLSDPTYAANARAFNQWLVEDWLRDYPHRNVFVFDFYNVLTSNGGSANQNDANLATGNHHRWWQGAVQYQIVGGGNVLAYPSSSDDDHPSAAGDRKATAEFVPLLNAAVHAWLAQPAAPPRLISARCHNGGFTLSVAGLTPGTRYTVECCTDIAAADWTNAGSFTCGSDTEEWLDPLAPAQRSRFYRVRTQ